MTPAQSQQILVLGGSGFVGHHLCHALSQHGHRVTVPTRRMPARSVQMLPGVSVVSANVHDAQALCQLVQGHDAVVNLVAILHGSAAAFEQVHVRLPETLARVCAESGVRRLVHVSALGANPQGPSMYQRSKGRGEVLLQAAAERGELDLTLLQPSVIFGRDDRFINLFTQLQRVFPVMPLAGARTRFQPVWVGDVVQALVQTLAQRRTIGHTYELAGPDVLSLRELVQLVGRHGGCLRPVLPLPHAVGWLQALAMEWLPGPTLMSRDNLASMAVDNVASGHRPGLSALGVATPRRLVQVFPAGGRG